MAYIPAVNTVKVEMVHTVDAQIVENVFHVLAETVVTVPIMTLMATAFKGWWVANMKALSPGANALTLIRCTDETTETGGGIEYTTGLPVAGDITDQPAPNNVTVAVKWNTGLRGRSFRGRTYHIGLSTGQYQYSTLNAGVASSLTAAYNALVADMVTNGWFLAVVSRRHNKAPRTTAEVTIIENCSIEHTLDSQRRRLPGRGR